MRFARLSAVTRRREDSRPMPISMAPLATRVSVSGDAPFTVNVVPEAAAM
jgi:hypothetical protein